MTLACPFCDGKSSVVLMRRASIQVRQPQLGTNHRRETAVRTRQCGNCRYKWKTIEMPVTRRRRPSAEN